MFVCAGEEHVSGSGQHPYPQHHGPSVRGAVVSRHPAQRSGQRRRRQQREDHQRLAAPQVSLPDHEHPAHGAVQGVRRVRDQQLQDAVWSSGAAAERQEQRGGGVCAGAHPAEHRQGQGQRSHSLLPVHSPPGLDTYGKNYGEILLCHCSVYNIAEYKILN